MTEVELLRKLQAPFHPEDIEWKPQTCGISGNGRAYVLAVPYLTNRAIQTRLDEVCGVMGWENQYKPAENEKGFLCGITIHFGEKSVTKWDGAESTHIEPLKGGLSNSMKRAAVQLGIGRYLYDLPEFWAPCVKCGTSFEYEGYEHVIKKGKNNKISENIAWKDPLLPEWALPTIDFNEYSKNIRNAQNIDELKAAFADAWSVAKINQNDDMKAIFEAEYQEIKSEFEYQAAQSSAKDAQAISEWLETEASSMSMVPNAAAVEMVYNTLRDKLAKKCANKFVDADSFQELLHNHYLARINQLEAQNKRTELCQTN